MDKSTLVKTTINELVENNTLSVETLTETLTNNDIDCKVELTNENRWEVYFKNDASSGDSISITHLEFEV